MGSFLFAKLWPGTADRAAFFCVHFLAAGKFHSLFSFLFGWGFALQMGRAQARGVRFFSFYARRLFVLLLIGLANWILLDWDQTLVEYALLGYLLFLFRNVSLKTAITVALLCLCYWPAQDAITIYGHAHRLADARTATITRQADASAAAEYDAKTAEYLRVHSHASFAQIVAADAPDAIGDLSSGYRYLGMLGYPFPLLLLGLYAGRRGILQNVSAHASFIRKVLWWGLGLGIFGNAVGVMVFQYPGFYKAPWDKSLLGNAAYFQVGIPALCFFYAAGIVLLAQKRSWKIRLAALAITGRMALTNYLLQVAVFDVLSRVRRFGLYGKMGPLAGIELGLLVFLLEVMFSRWWMARFRFGPVEWPWRTLTYGKLQPMRFPPHALADASFE